MAPPLEESVQSKRASAVLRHLTAATATGNVAVEQAWAAMEMEDDDDDVSSGPEAYAPLCHASRARAHASAAWTYARTIAEHFSLQKSTRNGSIHGCYPKGASAWSAALPVIQTP
jgi:hypothetical protein